jgi:putative transposase
VSKDNIIKLIQPANVEDALTEILRNGTRALLAQAVEAEVSEPVREHLESAESVVIQCRRLDS